jgi:hypothetical protein
MLMELRKPNDARNQLQKGIRTAKDRGYDRQ